MGSIFVDAAGGPAEVPIASLPKRQLLQLARAGDREATLLLLRRASRGRKYRARKQRRG
jgi:hypothetical protein